MEMPYRVGFGYDLHALEKDRKLILGGIEIPYERGLQGHSDADCLTHAICDAILGGAGLRDIGYYFPDTDPEFKGVDSQVLLAKSLEKVQELGYVVGNIDATIVAQEPKLNPYVEKMKAQLASVLKISPEAIGLKATTNENLDSTGKGEAIATHAVCMLYKA